MPPSRRLRRLLAVVPALLVVAGVAPASAQPAPTTTFERSMGATWTPHADELAFLAAVDAATDRVSVEVIGTTAQARPVHLVRIGAPAPATPAEARTRPTVLFTCSQHGNEPAGREACLIALRDLAFTTDAPTLALLAANTVLFVPSANPDGRAGNARTNTAGIDINRDHLNLVSPEAQAIGRVIRDYQPDVAVDTHEYGPGVPGVYDDDVLYLWPRNLNVDDPVHDRAVILARDRIGGAVRAAGYTADEYGISAVSTVDVTQTAGGGDEGILRNAVGLRHGLGILTETAVSANATARPMEAIDTPTNQRRRVDSDGVILDATLAYLAAEGAAAAQTTAEARQRATAEGAAGTRPVFFAGQDEDTTVDRSGDATVMAAAPACYRLTAEELATVRGTLGILDITTIPEGDGAIVTMAQPGEPLIPLLLDARASRNAVEAEPLAACPGALAPDAVIPEASAAALLPLVGLALGGFVLLRRRATRAC